jgi:hypothetical protein
MELITPACHTWRLFNIPHRNFIFYIYIVSIQRKATTSTDKSYVLESCLYPCQRPGRAAEELPIHREVTLKKFLLRKGSASRHLGHSYRLFVWCRLGDERGSNDEAERGSLRLARKFTSSPCPLERMDCNMHARRRFSCHLGRGCDGWGARTTRARPRIMP